MINDMEEKRIYKNALKKIVDLDNRIRDSFVQAGYACAADDRRRCFDEAVSIARQAILEGAMGHVKE